MKSSTLLLKCAAALFIVMIPTVLPAQVIRCYTTEHMNELKARDQKLEQRLQLSEQITQQWIAEHPDWQSLRTVPDTIPVVVHVLWHTSQENISDAQVISQIDVENEDFGRYNADTVNTPAPFVSVASAVPFQFCLAQRDPDGNPTNGIERRYVSSGSLGSDDQIKFYSGGGLDAWDVTRYMNIWVVDFGGYLLGYAELPTNNPSNTFGVVIQYDAFGRVGTVTPPYDLGRTTSHEFAHCFNLFHIWGDDGGGCSGSDQVSDTPNQGDATFGCPSFPHLDNCTSTGNGIMFMDYMDYSNDDCVNMYTAGQATRMVAAINSFYPTLLTSDGCVQVILQVNDAGAITVNAPSGTYNCTGSVIPSVALKNWGTAVLTSANIKYQVDGGTVNTYAWSGNLASLTSVNVTLPSIGVADGVHTLKVFPTQPNGVADQDHSNDTASSSFSVYNVGTAPPIVQGFESVAFPPTGWGLNNYDGDFTWQRTTLAHKSGAASTRVVNYDYNSPGEHDDLNSLIVNLSGTSNPQLSFQVAYTYYEDNNSTHYDSLRVLISPNCGATWSSIYYKGGEELKTKNPQSFPFVPTILQWRKETVDLTPYGLATQAIIKFRNINGYGNNLYLDDININSFTGISNPPENVSVSVSPNPGNGVFTLSIQSLFSDEYRFNVLNSLGVLVHQEKIHKTHDGDYQMNLTDLPPGIYFLQYQLNGFIRMDKLVIQK